ncbi:toprim domain-containing protein [Lactococcus petauri]|uniref:toprim domain-containing protein n=1 Tax=Lactococcus petauri TaxID=1940789 RepID=UPI001F56D778|nr:toprim domain-containing protein [Lactococcus petauri]
MNYQRPQKKSRTTHKERERLVEEAKSKDIFAVAQQLGMKVERNGKAEWEGHTSFWLDRKKNRFQWYGKHLWGDPVTLVSVIKFGARSIEEYKKNYSKSIAYLTNTEVPQFDQSKVPKPRPFHYYLQEATSMSLARDYLINERGLSPETVQFFEEKGRITQSVWKNKLDDGSTFIEPVVVFKHLNGKNKMLGGSVQGIEYHPELHTDHKSGHLKRVIKNSGAYSGLAVDIGEPKRIVVCESPIDLLSYYELHNESLKDVKLIASDGYKPQVLSYYVAEMYGKPDLSLSEKEKFLETFDKLSPTMTGYAKNTITFAYDNDDAGRGFIEQFKAHYPNSEKYTTVALPPLEKGKVKTDWNEVLKTLKKEVHHHEPSFLVSKQKGEIMEKVEHSEKQEESVVKEVFSTSSETQSTTTQVQAPERKSERSFFEAVIEEFELSDHFFIVQDDYRTTLLKQQPHGGKVIVDLEGDGTLNFSSKADHLVEVEGFEEKVTQYYEKFSQKEGVALSTGAILVQKYEQIIQEQEALLEHLSAKFEESMHQHAEFLEKLRATTPENESKEGKNKKALTSDTKALAFEIPHTLQEIKERLSEIKLQVKQAMKDKAQRGLSATFDKLKVLNMLEALKENLEKLSQKVEHVDTQLKVLSGQQKKEKVQEKQKEKNSVSPKEIQGEQKKTQDRETSKAQETRGKQESTSASQEKKSNIKIGEYRQTQNKFEERLAQAKIKNKQLAENYAKQKEQIENLRKMQK